MDTDSNIRKDRKPAKQPYHKPTLSLLGGIGEITQSGLNGSLEKGNPSGKGQRFRRS